MFAPNERRQTPLIVVASDNGAAAEALVAQLRSEGAVAYATRGAQGCLRMATSIAPDYVLLDAALPPRVEKLLKAHPASASADVMRWSNGHLPEHLPWSAPQPARPTPVFHLAAA
jgi:CheY-like chemotaxis protein